MKGIKQLLMGSLVVLCALPGLAQYGYYHDVLTFGQTQIGGTARMRSFGGAQTALGGDLSNAGGNPAGLGFFNRSTFAFSPVFNFNTVQSDYLGSKRQGFESALKVGHMGAVFFYGKDEATAGKWRGGSLGISINRIKNFNHQAEMDGYNNMSSIINSFVENPEGAYADAAYDHFIINPHEYNYQFDEGFGEILGYDTTDFIGYSSPYETSVPRQQMSVKTNGGQYAINLGYGGNYDDKIYMGANLGIQTIDYTRRTIYTESEYFVVEERNGDEVLGYGDDALDHLRIEDNIYISGAGVNLSMGVIVRPLNFLTVGATFQTPTALALSEESSYDFTTSYYDKFDYTLVEFDTYDADNDPSTQYLYTTYDLQNLDNNPYLSDIYSSNYYITTPGRINLGAAVFLGKRGFLTADAELVDYGSSRVGSEDFVATEDNDVIKDIYKAAMNYRLGGELRLDKFRFRGGFAFEGDPFAESNVDRTRMEATTGFGYRNKDFYLDVMAGHKWYNTFITPYEVSFDAPEAKISTAQETLNITFGLNF
ncbi:MAG: hypothetical protein JXQ90_21015 [Cyclobacteriaceae bacterium]